MMGACSRRPAESGGFDAGYDEHVVVWPADGRATTLARAAALARRLGLRLAGADDAAGGVRLVVTARRLELRLNRPDAPGPVYVDFVGGPLGYSRRVNRLGLLFRAVGWHTGARVLVDATAGLAHDAFRLAYGGFEVVAIERSPVLGALIQDGIDRASAVEALRDVTDRRLRLVVGDARHVLPRLASATGPDVVYLDPMFPPKRKSALVKKDMRVLRAVVGDDDDAGELFAVARRVARRRVVVKRMRHAPPLAPDPTRVIKGKTTRYDVYEVGG